MKSTISHHQNPIVRELNTFARLLRSIPAPTLALFVLSVIITNLMAAKFIVNTPYIAVTGGVLLSWLPFLCMDVVTKHFGPKAAIRMNIFGLFMYLCCIGVFELVTHIQIDTLNQTPQDYSAFNSVYGTQWWVLFCSSAAFVVSGIVNSVMNYKIGNAFKTNPDGKLAYVTRCYVSTFVGQFVDNFLFVGLLLFGFSGGNLSAAISLPVIGAAALGGFLELVTEVVFSPIGYRVVKKWKERNVGCEYLEG